MYIVIDGNTAEVIDSNTSTEYIKDDDRELYAQFKEIDVEDVEKYQSFTTKVDPLVLYSGAAAMALSFAAGQYGLHNVVTRIQYEREMNEHYASNDEYLAWQEFKAQQVTNEA